MIDKLPKADVLTDARRIKSVTMKLKHFQAGAQRMSQKLRRVRQRPGDAWEEHGSEITVSELINTSHTANWARV